LLSLQKGFGSEQLETCSFKDLFVSCQDQINDTWDFLETAAIIANCYLVITSDTSVAHLAGGMGKTTWLLLHKIPDWRWGLEGDTSFWYPYMRLFRQSERGNWDEVMERVAAELQKQFGGASANTQPI
jgi:ADP-heptose:LPS heptosyltransferase